MALARIISRSHQCARELAFDLLARGYTVEIVSPDAIPDNFADLELRVESGPDNALTATVETHTGARSASLEFVHHLKAPMRDFMRRTPEPLEPVSLATIPSLDTEHGVTRPSFAESALADPIVADHSLNFDLTSTDGDTAESISVSQQLQRPEIDSSGILGTDAIVDAREPESERKTKSTTASFLTTWHWRSGVAFAALLVVAIALGFTVRHQNYFAPTSTADASGSQNFAMTSAPTNPPATVEPSIPLVAKPVAIVPSASGPRETNRQQVQSSKKPSSPKTKVTIAKRQRSDDVAPNTVVYFDHRTAQSNPAKKIPRHAQRSTGDGVIASTTTPDLSAKPAPKAAPQR